MMIRIQKGMCKNGRNIRLEIDWAGSYQLDIAQNSKDKLVEKEKLKDSNFFPLDIWILNFQYLLDNYTSYF